jgi:hypothetical protein
VDDNQLAATKDIASFLRARLGEQPELWIKDIASSREFVVDLVLDTTGEIIAEPPFIARRAEARFAVYAAEAPPSRPERFRIEDAGFAVKLVGDPPLRRPSWAQNDSRSFDWISGRDDNESKP